MIRDSMILQTPSSQKRVRCRRSTPPLVFSNEGQINSDKYRKGQRRITFKSTVDLWLVSNEGRYKGSTENKYSYLLNTHILPSLGDVPISQLSTKRINDFLKEKTHSGRLDGTGGLSPSYVRSIMLLINSVLKFADANSLRQPMAGATYKPTIEKSVVDVLSLDEQRRLEDYLLDRCNPSKLGVFLALQTGLRIGEVCALSWNDVDMQKRLIHVRHTIVRAPKVSEATTNSLCLDVPKTRSSLRTIPMPTRLSSILESAYKDRESDYVASKRDGFVSPRTFDYRYHRILKQSMVPNRNFHTLRHTFATRCIEAGVDVKTLSEILGHSNTSITLNTYVHSSLELKRNQLERMTTYLS